MCCSAGLQHASRCRRHEWLASFATRRELLCAAAAVCGCGKRKGSGYDGYAFVANEEGHSVSAVDLLSFTVARQIKLADAPKAVIAHPDQPVVYALTPRSGAVHEIDAVRLEVRRTLHVAASAVGMRLHPETGALWVLSREGRRLVRIALPDLTRSGHIPLPFDADDFDISRYHDIAAVSHFSTGSVALLDVAGQSASKPLKIADRTGVVRFRADGKALMVANTADRMLAVLESPSGRMITQLPLAVRPDQLCFNSDGGQLFITGEGRDAVVVVWAYYVPEVAETVLAGHAPGAMAASRNFLFVANPSTSDVSILNINRRKVVAVAAVGTEPAHITVTPDDEYALVLNRTSGDMAVIRTRAIEQNRRKSAALFTMIPVGSKPVSAVVKEAG